MKTFFACMITLVVLETVHHLDPFAAWTLAFAVLIYCLWRGLRPNYLANVEAERRAKQWMRDHGHDPH